MATLRPFKGLLPQSKVASRVASLPYDVLDTHEARELANPDSFLHVIKPEIDLTDDIPADDPQVYARGKINLQELVDRGILSQDGSPCYYIYRQIMGDHVQTGLVACASVDEYWSNQVKKHEHTRPDKVRDRVSLMKSLNAQTGPVFLAYKSQPEVKALIAEAMIGEPLFDFTSFFDIRHILYRVENPDLVARIEVAFTKVPALYIADGHHRSEGAAEYCMYRREAEPEFTGMEEYNFFLTVSFPEDELLVLPYNRVISDLNGYSAESLLEKIAEQFTVTRKGPDFTGPERLNQFGIYLAGQWYVMDAKPALLDGKDAVTGLDVAILQDHVLAPLLGIDDPRTNSRIKFVGGLDSVTRMKKMVDQGQFAVAFSLFPTRMGQVMDVADAGKVMPPKSTWFEPKLLSGMVTHLLDE